MLDALASLSQAQHASGFLHLLTQIASERCRAHGAQARLGEALGVLCAHGRGLGLSDGSLARQALTTGQPQRSGMICALPLLNGSLTGVTRRALHWRAVPARCWKSSAARKRPLPRSSWPCRC